MRQFFSFILLLSFGFLFIGFEYAFAGQFLTRVAIVKDAKDVALSIRGSYHIIDPKRNEVVMSGRRYLPSRIVPAAKGFYLGKKFFPFDELVIQAEKDVSVYLRDTKPKKYRGQIQVYIKDDLITLVNTLDLESYVQGVLFHEVKHRWPMAVLKAQAVATRTYALYQIFQNRQSQWDVTSDIYSQVYGGISAERYRTNLAVKRTSGLILMKRGEIIPAYFHANSGGHTENAGALWNHPDNLITGRVDRYSVGQPGHQWKRNFRSQDITEVLASKGYQVGKIKTIEILNRTASGRVNDMLIHSRDGRQTKISGKDFRLKVGPNLVRSLLFDVEMKGYFFDLIGKGWGHGVGMSQWGAYQMSKERYDFAEILMFYYPGTDMVIVDDL